MTTTESCAIFFIIVACKEDVDLIFMLDASGSIGETNFGISLDFVESIVRTMDLDSGRVQAGLLLYR